ncbi:MAG: hypothetical protein IPO89_03145 [Actinomycetales bacterium]|nr:hypothetical protein [Candidatus Lutibacillus vidarii]HRB98953.1 hypothetical protein [Dermatophilaceae bacterium]
MSKALGVEVEQVTPEEGVACSYRAEDIGVHLWATDNLDAAISSVQSGVKPTKETLASGAVRSYGEGNLYNTCSLAASSGGAAGLVAETKDARSTPLPAKDLCAATELLFLQGTRAGAPSASVGPTGEAPAVTVSPTPTAAGTLEGGPSLTTEDFNGYTILLPPGSVKGKTVTGEYGEVRRSYETPDGTLTTIAFSSNFGWSEFSEEITGDCPQASEGKQVPIDWGGSYHGGYTVWDRSSCNKEPLSTFVTFSDVEQVAVTLDGARTPPAWLIDAVGSADWSE